MPGLELNSRRSIGPPRFHRASHNLGDIRFIETVAAVGMIESILVTSNNCSTRGDSPAATIRMPHSCTSSLAGRGNRQPNPKLRAALPRLDFDGADDLAHQAADNIEPRPVPCPIGLVLKNGSKIRSRSALECPVRCRQCGQLRFDLRCSRNLDAAPFTYRIQCVVDQVAPYLTQLASKTTRRRQAVLQFHSHSHRFLARLRP